MKYTVHIVSMLLMSADSVGYAYQLRIMKKFNKQLNRDQYVIGCSDYHDKMHPANQLQRSYIEALSTHYSRKDITYIVEDLGSANNNGRMFCCGYALNNCGLLGGFANAMRLQGKDVENIEYRYCRVASIGPLLSQPSINPYEIKSSATLTMNLLYNELINELNIIKNYHDDARLTHVYNRSIEHIMHSMRRLSISESNKKSVAQYCAQLNKRRYQELLQELCMFDSALIDINMTHAVLAACKKPYVIMLAGGAHINNTCALLERIGYVHVFSTPITIVSEQLKNSLHTQDKSTHEKKPQAIDVRIIERFLR